MNYVSLGYVCAIARELEKLGLRDSSMPFDWNVTNFEGVIKAINNKFSDYLEYEKLFQDAKCCKHYKNNDYDVQFFHDFNRFESLEKQLPLVQAKYNRRIKRFYDVIKERTIFVRYISDENKVNGKSDELIWIENNYDYIISSLKFFNKENDIIFIANEGVVSTKIKIFNVNKDKGDKITRRPITKNQEIKKLFDGQIDLKNKNLTRFNRKKIRLLKLLKCLFSLSFILKSIKLGFCRLCSKEYQHHQQY